MAPLFIDFPPAVDLIAHPDGLQLLERDVLTCASGRGATVSRATRGELFAELVAIGL